MTSAKAQRDDIQRVLLSSDWTEMLQYFSIASGIAALITGIVTAIFQFGIIYLPVIFFAFLIASIPLFYILRRKKNRKNSISLRNSLVFRPAEPLGYRDGNRLEGKELQLDQEVLFLSRMDEVLSLTERCSKQRLTVLSGDSGCGKTSLIHAGLVPKISKEVICVIVKSGYENVSNTLWRNALTNLRIQTNIDQIPSESSYDDLHDILKILKQKTLLVFDQFEQLFINSNKRDEEVFYKRLRELVTDPTLNCCVLIVIRREWFTHLIPLEDLVGSFTKHCFLEKLSNSEALNSINCMFDVSKDRAQTTDSLREKFEPQLIETIVEDLNTGDVNSINPIELQCICATLEILKLKTQDQYLLLGRKDGVQRRFFKLLTEDLGTKDKILAWRLFLVLGYKQNGRWALTEDEIRRLTFQEKHETVAKILKHFVHQGIVLPSSEARYEFAHDFFATLCRYQSEMEMSGEIVANTDFVLRITTEERPSSQRGQFLQLICNAWPSRKYRAAIWIILGLLFVFQFSRIFLWQPSHSIDPLEILQFSNWRVGPVDVLVVPGALASIVVGIFAGLLLTGPLKYIPTIQNGIEVIIPLFVLIIYFICVILGTVFWYSWISLGGIFTISIVIGFWIFAAKYRKLPQVRDKFKDYSKILIVNSILMVIGGVGFIAAVYWYVHFYSGGNQPLMAPVLVGASFVGALIIFGVSVVWNRDFIGVKRNDWQGIRWVGEIMLDELRRKP